MESKTAPAGWYPDGTGHLRWWDGTTWTAHSTAPPQRSEEADGAFLASMSWWGGLLLSFICPLVIFVVNRPGKPGANRFARFHAGEALNVLLTFLIVALPLQATYLALFFTSAEFGGARAASDPPPAFFAVWAASMLVGVAQIAICILGAVRANRKTWWKATYAIPFLRAHRRDHLD